MRPPASQAGPGFKRATHRPGPRLVCFIEGATVRMFPSHRPSSVVLGNHALQGKVLEELLRARHGRGVGGHLDQESIEHRQHIP